MNLGVTFIGILICIKVNKVIKEELVFILRIKKHKPKDKEILKSKGKIEI